MYCCSGWRLRANCVDLLQKCDLTGEECHGDCRDLIEEMQEHVCFEPAVDGYFAGIGIGPLIDQLDLDIGEQ